MLRKISMLKTEVLLLVTFVAFSTSSCAQQYKKEEKPTPKEQTNGAALQTVKMPVTGMTCSACQSNIKNTIKSIDGVFDVQVSLEKKFARFTFDPKKVKVEQVQKAVNNKGYTAGKPQEVKQ